MTSIKKRFKKLFDDNEKVTIYSTYGYRKGGNWRIPIRLWVHEPRKQLEKVVMFLAKGLGKVTGLERRNLKVRIADIIADSESREKVIFKFDKDHEEEEWQVRSKNGKHPKTDLNGILEGFLDLPDERAKILLAQQGSRNGWLTFHAVSKDHTGVGLVRLIEPEGLSLVSDIDDTIKITDIPAGKRTVVRNTFFHDFAAVPEMLIAYNKLVGETSFHYVSGGPWQLYRPLFNFIDNQGFPKGSFHMKSVPKQMLSIKTWKDLGKLVGGATVRQKNQQIGRIMKEFPRRKFILVGDSGENDPEIYSQLRNKFGDQIKEIWIRDVIKAREKTPDRLKGMKIIAT